MYRIFAAIILIAGFFMIVPTVEAATDTEQARINNLLGAVTAQRDMIFIRNGAEYTAQEAADHLRHKMRRAGSRISTAEEFIDYLGTTSSISKKPYMVRQSGLPPEPAGPFLHRLLRELDQAGSE